MSEQQKVYSLDQEIILKNTEIFVDITKILGQLLKKNLANFSFSGTDSIISFDSSIEVTGAFNNYSPQTVQSVTEEMVELTLKLLGNEESQLLTIAQEEGKTAHAVLTEKIKVVKENIALDKLQKAFHFYRTSIGNVLEQFLAQRIVKPASGNFPVQNTVQVKLTTRDNLDSSFRQSINFELYEEQLDEIIKIISDIKKDFHPSPN